MSIIEQEMQDPTNRLDFWKFIDNAPYEVEYIKYEQTQVWVNKIARMIWDAERREFVGENQRVPSDQVSSAVRLS